MPAALSKTGTNWGFWVSGGLAFANWIYPLPVPDPWKPVLGAVAWAGFLFCCVGWATAHIKWLARLRARLSTRRRLMFVLVFLVCGGLGIGLYWLLEKDSPEHAKENHSSKTNDLKSDNLSPARTNLSLSVLGCRYNPENRALDAQLLFRNDSERKRTILSVKFVVWDPDRENKTSYNILGANLDDLILGDAKPLSVDPKSEEVRRYSHVVMGPNDLQKPGTEIGLQITVADTKGAVKTKTIALIEARAVPTDLIKSGVGFVSKRVENVSLDE
jgi:hypothetical protein